jgi:uncharacterized iron-regulated membrane protein
VAAGGVFLLSASGLVMWWQRRPKGKLGAPLAVAPLPRAVIWGTLALAVFLPLLGASLMVLLLFDRRLLRLLPWSRPHVA